MSFKQHDQPDKSSRPKEPHLGLLLPDGRMLAIPKGATIYIVEDPDRVDTQVPLVVDEVGLRKLSFVAHGSDGAITKYTYKLQSGRPLNKAALQRIVRNKGETLK